MTKRAHIDHAGSLKLDRELLTNAGLREDSDVEVTIRDGALIIRAVPVRSFDESLNRVVSEYDSVLKRLAE